MAHMSIRKLMRAALLAGCAALLGMACAACFGGGGGGDDNGAPGRSGGTAAATVPPAATGDCGAVTTITTVKALRDYEILKNGDTPDNNPITRWALDSLCVKQTNAWMVKDVDNALSERIRAALIGGEQLPDVVFLTNHELPSLLGDLVQAGAIEDIEAAFDRYASARVREAYSRSPDAWRTVTLNGRRWGLPQLSDGKLGDPVLWIRQDWLETLGLEAPRTLSELEQVMDAFTHGDPDRNGKDDTIGLALAGQTGLNAWMGDASFLFGAYGDQPAQWNRGADGALSYGSVQPSVKRALARLADWYKAGYLAPDFGTHDVNEAAALASSGTAGIISGPGWMGGWPLGEGVAAGVNFRAYPYPSGDDGRAGRLGTRPSYGAYLFRAGFDHFDKIFAYYDEVFGALTEDPSSAFAYGYGEGYDYIVQDGQPVYDFDGVTSSIGNFLLVAPGSVPTPAGSESIEARVYRGHMSNPYERKLAATSSKRYLEGRLAAEAQPELSRPEQFVGPYTKTMLLSWRRLSQLEHDAYLRIVYGEDPPAAFDDFAGEWYAGGGSDIVREVNEADRAAQQMAPAAGRT